MFINNVQGRDKQMLENRILAYYIAPQHRNQIVHEELDFIPIKDRILGKNNIPGVMDFSNEWASVALEMNNKNTRGNTLSLPEEEENRFKKQLGIKVGGRRKRRGTKRRRVSSKKKRSTRRRR
jgi:hypothetical protein